MTEWGRNAGTATTSPARAGWSRAGKSVFCALLALGSVLVPGAALTALPTDVPEYLSTVVTIAVALAFLVVAPVLHVAGIVFGLMAAFGRGDKRLLGGFAAVLNLGLLALGVFLLAMASSSIGAFT